ncbi:acyl-CoA thioester hydrolase [Caldovatus sediminis]|jgi:acyl-CoA thioester hydrolase|uniref:Acyl-CoA thioester hydrolase n=1 Tax=Caldovatus sediminis TaxID=2041189 RepID=A0A8J3EAL5_9PROT|nr:thioesterase family protein [Caldovatus sediminis]GGG17679.1 acyl-CoA thioester hydrolase [Caldovatus sediminis]
MDPICLTFPIRTYDIDFAGIVSNIVYIRWLEDLRVELLARSYPLDRMVADGLGPVLLETHIAYRDALTIHDRPEGRMSVAAIGRVRWTVAAEFVSPGTGRVHATARQTGLFVRLATRRPVPIPDPLRAALA